MQFYFAYLRGRLAVLASDSLLSSLYDVSSGQTVLLAQEGLSAYLAEAIWKHSKKPYCAVTDTCANGANDMESKYQPLQYIISSTLMNTLS